MASKQNWLLGSLSSRAEADTRKSETMHPVGDIFLVPVADIDLDPNQPRREYSQAEILELAASISRHGLLHPITIRRSGERWIIIAGHRRFKAVSQLGWQTIRSTVERKGVDDLAVLELQLAENVQRQDLSPIETARAYQRMITDWNVSQADLAEMLGISASKVSRALRLLELAPEVQQQVGTGSVPASTAVNDAPRKRPRKAKPRKPPTKWTHKPTKAVSVTIQATKGTLDQAAIVIALEATLEAAKGQLAKAA